MIPNVHTHTHIDREIHMLGIILLVPCSIIPRYQTISLNFTSISSKMLMVTHGFFNSSIHQFQLAKNSSHRTHLSFGLRTQHRMAPSEIFFLVRAPRRSQCCAKVYTGFILIFGLNYSDLQTRQSVSRMGKIMVPFCIHIFSYISQASHFSNFCGVVMDIIISRRSSGDINHLWGQGRFSRSCPNSSAPEKQGMMDRQLLSHAWRNLKWLYIDILPCEKPTVRKKHTVDLVHRDWGCQGFGMQCQYSDPL